MIKFRKGDVISSDGVRVPYFPVNSDGTINDEKNWNNGCYNCTNREFYSYHPLNSEFIQLKGDTTIWFKASDFIILKSISRNIQIPTIYE